MHLARDPATLIGEEGVGFCVFEVVGHFVQERIEKLFDGPTTLSTFVGVDSNQASRLVITTQHAAGWAGIDVDDELDPACMDQRQPTPKQWPES